MRAETKSRQEVRNRVQNHEENTKSIRGYNGVKKLSPYGGQKQSPHMAGTETKSSKAGRERERGIRVAAATAGTGLENGKCLCCGPRPALYIRRQLDQGCGAARSDWSSRSSLTRRDPGTGYISEGSVRPAHHTRSDHPFRPGSRSNNTSLSAL